MNNEFPVVSIVVPCRAEEFFGTFERFSGLLSAIDKGVRSQFELVVAIDNDTSDVPNLQSAKSEDVNAIAVQTQGNGHIGAIRNAGVAESKGVWLLFLDSDCTICPESLAAIFDMLPSTSVAVGDTIFTGRNWVSKLEGRLRTIRYGDAVHAYCPNLLIRRAFFDQLNGFDGSYKYGSDGDFSERVLRNCGAVIRLKALTVTHECDTSLIRTVRRWMLYGEGRHKRYVKLSVPLRARTYFPQKMRRRYGFLLNVTILAHNCARAIGSTYSIWKVGL